MGNDTHKINHMKLYIDPLSTEDYLDGINYPYYVFTEGRISSSVLKLYAFHEEHYYKGGYGVAHIHLDFRPVSNKAIKKYAKLNAT